MNWITLKIYFPNWSEYINDRWLLISELRAVYGEGSYFTFQSKKKYKVPVLEFHFKAKTIKNAEQKFFKEFNHWFKIGIESYVFEEGHDEKRRYKYYTNEMIECFIAISNTIMRIEPKDAYYFLFSLENTLENIYGMSYRQQYLFHRDLTWIYIKLCAKVIFDHYKRSLRRFLRIEN